VSEPAGWNVYDGSTFREFIPNEASGSPWVHVLGAASGPASTVRETLPPWWAVHPPNWTPPGCRECRQVKD
jgi:hypothetical protein